MGDESGPGPQAMASGADSEVPGIASVISGFGSTEAALAAVHDVALLDLDGVVYVGSGVVAHAAESLDAALDAHGMRSAFVTNNAARTPATVAAHLVALGLRATPADVVTSAQAGARMLAERLPSGSRVLVIGGPGVGEALRERGLVAVESVDDGAVALMQGYGPDVGWRSLAEGSLAIGRGLLWVATNLDRTIPSPRGRVLGNGSMVAALRHATGVEPLVAGKPEPPLMLESVQRSGAVRPLVVGDRLDTDIEGANRSGIPSLLVLTGVTDWQDLLDAAPLHRPTYLGLDLRALLEPAPPVEVRSGDTVVQARCGRVAVRIPTAMAGTRGPDPGLGSDVPGARVDPRSRLWWLPEALRDGGRHEAAAGDVDLDAVRAVVAAAWLIADSGRAIAGPAQVHAATG
jgi:HAD superfamily hydrolase (TIGR01450 family)